MSEVLPKPPTCTSGRASLPTPSQPSRLGSAGRALLAVLLGCVALLIIAPPALAQTGSITGEVRGVESKTIRTVPHLK